MREDNYHYELFSQEAKHLLMLAGLPLIDGFFLAFLTTSLWQDPWRAVAFGLTAFSGAGCVSVSIQLRGTIWSRLTTIGLVYSAVGIGALIVAAARSFFADLLPANLYLFTSIFLIGLGLWITEVPGLRRVALWMGFEAAVKAMIVASIVHGVISGVTWRLNFDPSLLAPLMLALGAGFGLTLGGMIMGVFFGQATEQPYLKLGAGVSLILMGLNVLGLSVPSEWVIAPLVVGCVVSVAVILRQKRSVGQVVAETGKPEEAQHHTSGIVESLS